MKRCNEKVNKGGCPHKKTKLSLNSGRIVRITIILDDGMDGK